MPPSPRRAAPWEALAPLGAAGLFVIVTAMFHPALRVFQLFKDEGYNWAKARLVADGYRLHSEIWSDQPPGFTWLLAGWGQLVGRGVPEARLFELVWAGLLVFAVGDVLRRECGLVAAAIGSVALVCSQYFMLQSMALLIGLPSIACACLSICALSRWRRSERFGWAAAAGALLGLSIAMKLFTFFLVPCALGWLIIHGRASASGWGRPLLAFVLATAAVPAAALLTVADPGQAFDQLVGTHLDAQAVNVGGRGIEAVPDAIRKDRAVFLLALVGLATVWFRDRRRPSVLPFYGAWLVVGTLLLLGHRPVRWHQLLLLTAPAAVLAGAAWRSDTGFRRRAVVVILVVLVGAVALRKGRLWELQGLRGPEEQTVYWEMLDEMVRYRDESHWVVAATPIFAAHLDLPLPPELAVTSGKRFDTGQLESSTIVEVIARDRPEQVLLTPDWRVSVLDEVRPALFEGYVRTQWNREDGLELFVRRDLLP